MSLRFIKLSFDRTPPSHGYTQTDDGRSLSILFAGLAVQSAASDRNAAPQTERHDLTIHCNGPGWVLVQLRGAAVSTSPQGYAHISARINGRQMHAQLSTSSEEPVVAACVAPVHDTGRLRLSLLLLAERDHGVANSTSGCRVDVIDLLAMSEERST